MRELRDALRHPQTIATTTSAKTTAETTTGTGTGTGTGTATAKRARSPRTAANIEATPARRNERAISFNDEMIAALLAGRKTQTRRLATGKNPTAKFGRPGDRLWVRQRWAQINDEDGLIRYVYSSDRNASALQREHRKIAWRPSYLMPRRACRTLLEIRSIRIEPLSAITESDAAAEGFEPVAIAFPAARPWFLDLWDRINTAVGTRAADDPAVCVIEFTIVPHEPGASDRQTTIC